MFYINTFSKRLISIMALTGVMYSSFAMKKNEEEEKNFKNKNQSQLVKQKNNKLIIKEIKNKISEYKKNRHHLSTTTINKQEKRHLKSVLKALRSGKLIIIIGIFLGCCVMWPILNATIPTSEVCEQTSNGTTCYQKKNEFLKSTYNILTVYGPYFLGALIIGTAMAIKAEINAISPIPSVNLDNDVVGLCPSTMEQIKGYIDYFNFPKRYEELGAKLPCGLLLVGPPGTGKTLIAKAIAGSANRAFFEQPASSIQFPSEIIDLFKLARKHIPSIVFIDEIDAFGIDRSKQVSDSKFGEIKKTFNQLLVELGSLNNKGIIVIAATNFAEILDEALTRSGRFDNIIEIGKPDLDGRAALLMHYLFKLPKLSDELFDSQFILDIAKKTDGFTSADFVNLVNQSALIAGRNKCLEINQSHVEEALKNIVSNKQALKQS